MFVSPQAHLVFPHRPLLMHFPAPHPAIPPCPGSLSMASNCQKHWVLFSPSLTLSMEPDGADVFLLESPPPHTVSYSPLPSVTANSLCPVQTQSSVHLRGLVSSLLHLSQVSDEPASPGPSHLSGLRILLGHPSTAAGKYSCQAVG